MNLPEIIQFSFIRNNFSHIIHYYLMLIQWKIE